MFSVHCSSLPKKNHDLLSCSALGQAAPNLAAISKARAAVTAILKMIENDTSASKNSDEGIVLSRIDGHIEFREVCFAYPSRPTTVFKDLSFSVSAGSH